MGGWRNREAWASVEGDVGIQRGLKRGEGRKETYRC